MKNRNGYNPKIVLAYFASCRLPRPRIEYRFHRERKWKFDFAWPDQQIALEVDGGIWSYGRHNRGSGITKTWEKENTANLLHWHIFKCEPKTLCTRQTTEMIRAALSYETETNPMAVPLADTMAS